MCSFINIWRNHKLARYSKQLNKVTVLLCSYRSVFWWSNNKSRKWFCKLKPVAFGVWVTILSLCRTVLARLQIRPYTRAVTITHAVCAHTSDSFGAKHRVAVQTMLARNTTAFYGERVRNIFRLQCRDILWSQQTLCAENASRFQIVCRPLNSRTRAEV